MQSRKELRAIVLINICFFSCYALRLDFFSERRAGQSGVDNSKWLPNSRCFKHKGADRRRCRRAVADSVLDGNCSPSVIHLPE